MPFCLGVKVNTRGSKQLEVMPSSFAEKGADNLSSGLLNHQLAFEGVPLLLARVEPALVPLGTLNRGFGDIDHDHISSAKAPQQLFFPRQAESPGLHQGVFNPMNNAANG